MKRPLVIAILAKSCAHVLPYYLKAIESQTVIDSLTSFYIRTNDNKDDTVKILRDWADKMEQNHEVIFDDTSIDDTLKDKDNHDWYYERFKILGAIRQKSIDYAISKGADYFIADCDNIIMPYTIAMLRSVNIPVIAPLLKTANPTSLYANYHSDIDENGYLKDCPNYSKFYTGEIKGIFEQPVIHCTYFIKNEYLRSVTYDDLSGRYEYVIFSDNLRKKGITQYLDNRMYYGTLFFSTNNEDFIKECSYPDSIKILSSYNL
jgi:hypothetical protein